MNIVDVNLIQIPLATWESSIKAQIYMKKNFSRGKHSPDYPTDPRKVWLKPKSIGNKTLVEENSQDKIS